MKPRQIRLDLDFDSGIHDPVLVCSRGRLEIQNKTTWEWTLVEKNNEPVGFSSLLSVTTMTRSGSRAVCVSPGRWSFPATAARC